jgi:hypothetical protein
VGSTITTTKSLIYMNNNKLIHTFILVAGLLFSSCSSPVKNDKEEAKDSAAFIKHLVDSAGGSVFFNITLRPYAQQFKKPALQSFASAMYKQYWILIGGQKAGFHGTANNPPPFMSSVANDSIWVINIATNQTWGVPVPAQYASFLSSSNPAFYQVGNSLYYCGGYTTSSTSSAQFDFTSDRLFMFDLPSLVQYVQSGGASPALSQVIPVAIQSPYVQVTGGEMFITGNNLYLIGGQNYSKVYTPGRNGIYTNAIRKFTIKPSGSGFQIGDTLSYIDPVNLHRRDMNLVPVFANGSLGAVLYGGVFTKEDMAFRNPVYITGWQSGNISITPDTAMLNANQYSCATVPIWNSYQATNYISFLGGISYKMYDTVSKSLVIGDHGMPLPFSNLISTVSTNGASSSVEQIQIPPSAPLMPKFVGSNAIFFPLPQYLVSGAPMIDINKVWSGSAPPTVIGYMYGGILSMGPTSGTTPQGHVYTYPNPVLYEVVISLSSSATTK